MYNRQSFLHQSVHYIEAKLYRGFTVNVTITGSFKGGLGGTGPPVDKILIKASILLNMDASQADCCIHYSALSCP